VIFGQGAWVWSACEVTRLSGAGLVITVDVRDEACEASANSERTTH